MTKEEVQNALDAIISDFPAEPSETLSQTDLTTLTDSLAGGLDTVNPNGPCYPPTPR